MLYIVKIAIFLLSTCRLCPWSYAVLDNLVSWALLMLQIAEQLEKQDRMFQLQLL